MLTSKVMSDVGHFAMMKDPDVFNGSSSLKRSQHSLGQPVATPNPTKPLG